MRYLKKNLFFSAIFFKMAAKSGGVEGCKIDMLLSTILERKQSKLQLSLIFFLIQPPIDWPTSAVLEAGLTSLLSFHTKS